MSGVQIAPLSVHGRPLETVFELLGRDENAMTFALGWCLAQAPALLDEVASELGDTAEPRPSVSSPAICLQERRGSTGIIDIEIHAPGRLAWIVEAKRGFDVPSPGQMEKYALRLGGVEDPVAARRLLVLARSDRRGAWLRSAVPSRVRGVAVSALSWRQAARAAARARAGAGHAAGRLLD